MDPISILVAALAAGASIAKTGAVKDAYSYLVSLVRRRLAGHPTAEAVLEQHSAYPEQYSGKLEAELLEAGAGNDEAAIEAARRVLDLVELSNERSSGSRYDAFLSFPGEERDYVRQVARLLSGRGVRVWFDEFEAGHLWGRDLQQYIDSAISASRYVIVFFSARHRNQRQRELENYLKVGIPAGSEQILPVTLRGAPPEGSLGKFINADRLSVETLVDLICLRLGFPLSGHELVDSPPARDDLDFGLAVDAPWSDRLLHLASLKTGWLDNNSEGIEIAFDSLRAADRFLRIIRDRGGSLPGIFPMPNGGVQLEWSIDRKVISIEIAPSGAVRADIYSADDDRQDELDAASIDEAAEFALNGLAR